MISGTHAIVVGYHGCDKQIGKAILDGKAQIRFSKNSYDWLGNGAYFWENNCDRAHRWAEQLKRDKKIKSPFVLGAVISLGNCLDLLSGDKLSELKRQYRFTRRKFAAIRFPLPSNPRPNNHGDILLRPLECLIIESLHQTRFQQNKPKYDTARGVFFEGKELFPGSAITENNHIQLCVRNRDAILGYFDPTK